MKKAALGLTLALTASLVLACTPNQTANKTRGYNVDGYNRTTGYYQDGTNYGTNYGNRGIGTYNMGNRQPLYGTRTDGRMGTYDGYRDGFYRDGYHPGGGPLYGGKAGVYTRDGYSGYGYGNRDGVHPMGVNTYDQGLARSVKSAVDKVPGVSGSHVVVYRNDVVVGIDSRDMARDGKNNKILTDARQAAERHANGKQVHVTMDRDLYNRIGTLDTDFRSGHPVRNAVNSFGVVIEDIGKGVRNTVR